MLLDTATTHVAAILREIFEWDLASSGKTESHPKTFLVYDTGTPLAQLLSSAYRQALPGMEAVDFDRSDPDTIKRKIEKLTPGDLVILVQSTSFRLDAFRIRVHLFERGLKVIEHPHLGRVLHEEMETYVAALAYDAAYYHRLGPDLKSRLDRAHEVKLIGGGEILTYEGPFEEAKLNIGDYRGMKNVGGQFPIGEVFTELKDLTRLNGRIPLFAFGDQTFSVAEASPPIVIEIKEGKLIAAHDATPGFEAVLKAIRDHEGDVWVRELGFGLNRALTRTSRISHDVGIYERMCGVHLSIGSKHALYPKEGFHKKKVKFHVDVFAAVDQVLVDGETVYKNGSYTL